MAKTLLLNKRLLTKDVTRLLYAKNKWMCLLDKHLHGAVWLLLMGFYSQILAFLVEWVSQGKFSAALSWAMGSGVQFYNSATLIFLVLLAVYLLTRRAYLSVLLTNLLFLIMAGANYYKVELRNEPVLPWDLGIAGEAAEILPSIDLSLTLPILLMAALALILTGVFLFRRIRWKKKPGARVWATLSLGVLSVFGIYVFSAAVFFNNSYISAHHITENQFEQVKNYQKNGLITGFMMNIRYISPEKPSDYSQQNVEQALSTVEKSAPSQVKPNIIVIMNEAFSDVTMFQNVSYDQELLPTVNWLRKDYMSGFLLTPQFGGGTANSEFEVLTGNTMANLPSGCTPYQQYLADKKLAAYPSFLKSLGYNTVAIHSFGRNFWSRDKVYENIGFDKFVASDDFVDPERYRGFISDQETVSRIVEEYQLNKETGKPFFNFTVTMQNHASYKSSQYEDYHLVNVTSDALSDTMKDRLAAYATGIRDADEALGSLISFFESEDDPTVIILFGDHLGNMGSVNESYIKGGYAGDIDGDPEEKRKLYSTPFVAWSNFGDNQDDAGNMSMYQLLPYITQQLGLDRPLYFDYLNQQAQLFKGFAQGVYLDSLGTPSWEFPSADAKDAFHKHWLLQYDLMFGKGYAANRLFSADGT